MQNRFIDQKEILGDLITDLCLSGKTSLDEQKINEIKRLCKFVSFYFYFNQFEKKLLLFLKY